MMLSICTLPMSPAKNSSSVTVALINLRAGRRTSSLESLKNENTELKRAHERLSCCADVD